MCKHSHSDRSQISVKRTNTIPDHVTQDHRIPPNAGCAIPHRRRLHDRVFIARCQSRYRQNLIFLPVTRMACSWIRSWQTAGTQLSILPRCSHCNFWLIFLAAGNRSSSRRSLLERPTLMLESEPLLGTVVCYSMSSPGMTNCIHSQWKLRIVISVILRWYYLI